MATSFDLAVASSAREVFELARNPVILAKAREEALIKVAAEIGADVDTVRMVAADDARISDMLVHFTRAALLGIWLANKMKSS